jgi:hypothetical protein
MKYAPLTRLLIIAGLTIVSWIIFGLAVYGAVQAAIKIWGPGI